MLSVFSVTSEKATEFTLALTSHRVILHTPRKQKGTERSMSVGQGEDKGKDQIVQGLLDLESEFSTLSQVQWEDMGGSRVGE